MENATETTENTAPQRNLILMQPEGYLHSYAYNELLQTLLCGFSALGLQFKFYFNEMNRDVPSIVVGAHLLDDASMANLPAKTIIYNTEQANENLSWENHAYLEMLKRHEVWDLSEENVRRLQNSGVSRAKYVPIGFVPELAQIALLPTEKQDIDVLFYGSLNPRRQKILTALNAQGLVVKHLFGVYGAERDEEIARAKIVLSLHIHEKSVFESLRVSYLLANEKAVVCEGLLGETIPHEYAEAVCAAPYDQLVATCTKLITDTKEREALAKKGKQIFMQQDEVNILKKAFGI